MICPNCNNTKLEIQNNHYYCPNCKIYIDSVDNAVQTLPSRTATSRWQLQSQSLNSTENVINDTRIYDAGAFIKQYLILIFVIMFLAAVYIVFTNIFNYLSFAPYCNIKIEGKSEGFKANASKALEMIRVRDQSKYQDICKYVSNITEGECPVSDERWSGGSTQFTNYCYIKGSKIIYLNNLGYLESTANLSKDFWENEK